MKCGIKPAVDVWNVVESIFKTLLYKNYSLKFQMEIPFKSQIND